jgi:hypothetical protein
MPLTMKRLALLLTVAVAALGSLAAAAIAMVADDPGSAGPTGVHITPLSKGTLASSVQAKAAGIEITTNGRKDILITKITVDPGGSFGWHSHPGPVLVTMGKGTLTVYDATKHGCRRSTVTTRRRVRRGRPPRPPGPQRGIRSGRAQRGLPRPSRHDRVPEDRARAAGLQRLSQPAAAKCTTPPASSSTTRPSSRSRSTWPRISLRVR